ncbi:hypothetical protein Ga0074812_13219 [Parafrankia irregularis]|uniref:Sodium:proton antiporter n=1 Tax=Parafrankia irregularis TaxID=795642 RepID=A0A0S4QZ38_9ACTN|nr:MULTISPECIES: DUF6328 family protein [Parafrankia]MBE3202557.1 hypothetical protein [Parafrankia sp. CH37]CUU59814.1 hypothetical protein Ga0074812_13219 [Parafrankia irregularis]
MSEIARPGTANERTESVDEEFGGRAAGESAQARRNRNWAEILQEIRVAQTGVQLLAAFLLALPFQSRFAILSDGQEWFYLAVVALAVVATGLLVTPVSLHRAMFRKREKEKLVMIANRLAQAGLGVFAVAVAGVAVLIFDVTKGVTAGVTAGVITLVLFIALWVVVPVAVQSVPAEGD